MHSKISKSLLLSFIIALASVNAAPFDDAKINALNAWQSFVQAYDKVYASDDEHEKRKDQFIANYLEIQEHNKNYDGEEVTYEMGVNQFTDLSPEEFVSQYTGAKVPEGVQIEKQSTAEEPFLQAAATTIPSSFDWRTKSNVLTAIKDQGNCGSCWAFGTTAVLEAAYNIKKGSLAGNFSEQQLVDCVTGNWGCNGGWPLTALNYAQLTGIATEANYPYTATDGTCNDPSVTKGYKSFNITSFTTSYTDLTLKTVIATKGPIAVPIDGTPLQSYSSGILNKRCSQLNHIVTIVGYGTSNGALYYIGRNSWGTSWGEKGYFRISATMAGNCYVKSMGWYPMYISV